MARREPRPTQAILDVDLDAIANNYRRLARLARGAACAGVVKADAYGLGAARIAPVLWQEGCRDFFVAHLDEAIALRACLPKAAAIHVLAGVLKGEEADLVRHDLTPVLNDLGQIALWRDGSRRRGRALPGCVHIDTGMARLGLDASETQRVIDDPQLLAGITPLTLMSHMACADEPGHELNDRQRKNFAGWARHFPTARKSLANSAAIVLDRRLHYDLVRPGCALYGITPIPGRPSPVKNVATLNAPVVALRTIGRGDSVGYGATFRARTHRRIATIALGYADGWLRALSGRGFACYRGGLLPFAGRVSMDLITIDATQAPALTIGERVEVLGRHLPADDVAARAGTNAYEVLTRLGPRFHRRYTGGATSA
jgi:alanine racemase